MSRWTWTLRSSRYGEYTELSRDGEVVGELRFIVRMDRPATLATDLCALLERHDLAVEVAEQAADEYHARRADERDAQPESVVNR